MITDFPLSTTPEAKLVPASFAQARLWFLNRLDPERSDYNVTVGWRIEGTLDVALLRDAMQIVVDRHEILRTTFVDVDGAPWQRISASFSTVTTEMNPPPESTRRESVRPVYARIV